MSPWRSDNFLQGMKIFLKGKIWNIQNLILIQPFWMFSWLSTHIHINVKTISDTGLACFIGSMINLHRYQSSSGLETFSLCSLFEHSRVQHSEGCSIPYTSSGMKCWGITLQPRTPRAFPVSAPHLQWFITLEERQCAPFSFLSSSSWSLRWV